MPGKKPQELRGLRFTAAPDDWLHRVLHWPFYFESTNYSFRIKVERVSAEDPNDPWPNNLIQCLAILESRDSQQKAFQVPDLAIGEKTTIVWEQIYIAHPGQTRFGILTRFGPNVDAQTLDLFSYKVRPEEAIWLAGAVLLITAFSVLIPLWITTIDDPPTVNIIVAPTAVPIAEATPTPESTMTTPTPTPQPTLDTADPPPQ